MSPFGPHTQASDVALTFHTRIQGRTFLITGTSAGGLGAHTALALARHGPAQLLLVSRTPAKVSPVIQQITAIDPAIRVTFIHCDLSDFSSVRAAAQAITSDAGIAKIDVVINNAGIMFLKAFTVDTQGCETTLSACHLGHFLLTNLLMGKIVAAVGPYGARIVNVSSHGHRVSPFRFEDWNFSGGATYDGWAAYGQAKTANILFSVALGRRLALAGHHVRSHAVEPGSIFETGLSGHISAEDLATINAVAVRNIGKAFDLAPRRTLDEGAASVLVAALDPALDERSGEYVSDCQVGEAEGYAVDGENAERLWKLSEEVVGGKFEL